MNFYRISQFFSTPSCTEALDEFRQIGRERTDNDEIDKKIFDLSKNKSDHLDVQRFIRVIRQTGLHLHDPRLDEVR